MISMCYKPSPPNIAEIARWVAALGAGETSAMPKPRREHSTQEQPSRRDASLNISLPAVERSTPEVAYEVCLYCCAAYGDVDVANKRVHAASGHAGALRGVRRHRGPRVLCVLHSAVSPATSGAMPPSRKMPSPCLLPQEAKSAVWCKRLLVDDRGRGGLGRFGRRGPIGRGSSQTDTGTGQAGRGAEN
jgi:hypothetical protein